MADSIEIQMQRIMADYSVKVQGVSRDACQKVSRKLAKTLRSTSPRKTGEYASGWTVKKQDEDTYIVHNRTKPGLTHLLENGHVSRNQYGTYGRVPAYKHIEPAANAAQEELIVEIEANL